MGKAEASAVSSSGVLQGLGLGLLGVVPQIRVPIWVPNIVRQPYNKDPKRDPNLDNYPYG